MGKYGDDTDGETCYIAFSDDGPISTESLKMGWGMWVAAGSGMWAVLS